MTSLLAHANIQLEKKTFSSPISVREIPKPRNTLRPVLPCCPADDAVARLKTLQPGYSDP